jgi:hypothetical protein
MFLAPLTKDLGIGLGAATMVGSLQVAPPGLASAPRSRWR